MGRLIVVGTAIMNVQHARTQALIGLSIAVLAGGAAVALRHAHRPRVAYRVYYPRVRDAGAVNMKNPPRDWDDVDDMADQSFPASDPPAIGGRGRFK